jgi:RND family efflux transporter MFP subunit
VGASGELTDGQLLERFATARGEVAELAFAVLLERHGPMVLRVCRGVLADEHDSQDAFQATFLVLVKKARGLWVRESLGPWLHQVAFRTASCARSAAARQRRHERRAAALGVTKEARIDPTDDQGRVLHEEIERLPESYRAPLVLCDLEGRTHEQAARHLGWPVGTVKSRLSRGRQRLGDRLRRRGLGPCAGLIAGRWPAGNVDAMVPRALVDSTIRGALAWATAGATSSAAATLLAQGVLRTMSLSRWWKLASALLVAGATASGVGMLAQNGASGVEQQVEANARPAPGADLSAAAVRSGPFRVTVAERGLLEATESSDVVCQVMGTTTIISILPEGKYVRKGTLVCELDPSTFQDLLKNQKTATLGAEAAYQNARMAREVAEVAVHEYAEGIYQSELAALQGAITSAQAAMQKAEARVARTRDALKRLRDASAHHAGALAPASVVAELDLEDRLDDASQTLLNEKNAFELARSKRDLLERYTRDKMVRRLQAEVEQAKSIELAKHQIVALEQDKEARLERQIGYCKLVAPNDGIVVYASERNRIGFPPIEKGAIVGEHQKIFSLPNIRAPMRVNAKVPEAIVDRLRPGQTARIKVDAFFGEVLSGKVETINPLPDSPSPSNPNRKVYTTRVSIEKGLSGLRPGMSAGVEILAAEHDNVLSVPVDAVLRFDGKDHVAVKNAEGGFAWREVTLGVANDKAVVVKQGLEDGELVIAHPATLRGDEEKRAEKGIPAAPARKQAAQP